MNSPENMLSLSKMIKMLEEAFIDLPNSFSLCSFAHLVFHGRFPFESGGHDDHRAPVEKFLCKFVSPLPAAPLPSGELI